MFIFTGLWICFVGLIVLVTVDLFRMHHGTKWLDYRALLKGHLATKVIVTIGVLLIMTGAILDPRFSTVAESKGASERMAIFGFCLMLLVSFYFHPLDGTEKTRGQTAITHEEARNSLPTILFVSGMFLFFLGLVWTFFAPIAY